MRSSMHTQDINTIDKNLLSSTESNVTPEVSIRKPFNIIRYCLVLITYKKFIEIFILKLN